MDTFYWSVSKHRTHGAVKALCSTERFLSKVLLKKTLILLQEVHLEHSFVFITNLSEPSFVKCGFHSRSISISAGYNILWVVCAFLSFECMEKTCCSRIGCTYCSTTWHGLEVHRSMSHQAFSAVENVALHCAIRWCRGAATGHLPRIIQLRGLYSSRLAKHLTQLE